MPKRSNKVIPVLGADCPLDHLMKSSQIVNFDCLLEGNAAIIPFSFFWFVTNLKDILDTILSTSTMLYYLHPFPISLIS